MIIDGKFTDLITRSFFVKGINLNVMNIDKTTLKLNFLLIQNQILFGYNSYSDQLNLFFFGNVPFINQNIFIAQFLLSYIK